MAENEDEGLPPEALALKYLREAAGMKRKALAFKLGHANDTILGRAERGVTRPARDTLLGYVEPAGGSPEAVDALLALHPLVTHQPPDEPWSPVDPTSEKLERIDRACLAAVSGLLPDFRATLVAEDKARKAAAARQDAKERWKVLLKVPSWKERRTLVETWPRYRTWGLVERACEASERKAHDRADDALELARFALFIAERIPENGLRARASGFCWGHIANAQRVGEDFDAADRSFDHAWYLWHVGAETDPDIFPEWKLLDLEASLRREQERFPEALERLDRAWELGRGNKLAEARILLKKEHVLAEMRDFEGALAVLDEAAPLVEELEDPRVLFALRLNRADDLSPLDALPRGGAPPPGSPENGGWGAWGFEPASS